MTFGEKLQKLRKEKGWTQEQLASQINISRQSLSKWELDAVLPDTENIILLSKLFHVSTDYLLMDKSQEEPVKSMQQPSTRSSRIRIFAGIGLLVFSMLGLLTIGICSSIFPSTHLVFPADENWVRVYSGLLGFLMVHHLQGLFILLIILFCIGLFTVFYPKIQLLKRRK